MRLNFYLAFFLFSLSLTAFGSTPCVPAGSSVDIEFTNPSVAGYPSGAALTGVVGMEQDPGPDDDLGAGSLGRTTSTITISNDGSNLVGPNGETGDGSPGDDCFEVYLVWTVTYQVRIPILGGLAKLGKDGISGAGAGTFIVLTLTDEIESGVKEVCPC